MTCPCCGFDDSITGPLRDMLMQFQPSAGVTRQIIMSLHENPGLTSGEVEKLNGKSARTILRRLRKTGLATCENDRIEKKGRFYRIVRNYLTRTRDET